MLRRSNPPPLGSVASIPTASSNAMHRTRPDEHFRDIQH